MSIKIEKRIRIIKRVEQQRALLEAEDIVEVPRTPAQAQREMVSTIISWINDRKNGSQGSPVLDPTTMRSIR